MAESRLPKLGDPLAKGLGVNQRLGDYEILKRLAVGGMAEIFLARVRKLTGFQKMVVIKRILPQLAQNTDFVEMFLDEARIAATLEHPHIVQTYDVGMIDDSYYIAMEYLHGEDVRSIMRAVNTRLQAPPIEQALHIVISAAAGLHYAHEKVGFDGAPLDIVHRDVSPQNLIVTYEGSVKLLDFGIAKASNRLRETRVGTLKGKVPYMSPEQCRSESLDRRSDIYSLGILMWELTLSRRLYRGTSDFEVLKEIVEGRVTPPREIDPSYPPALEAIVMKALEKDRENRWHTAREMQAELEHFVRKEQIAATPIATQQFMHQLFGDKIEVWRDAQAAGQTLDEHLLTLTPEYSDTKEIEISDPNAERIKAERDAFIAKLNKPVMIQAEPSVIVGTGSRSGASQLVIPKSGQLGRVAGAAVALLLTVAAGAYALLSHVQGPATIAAPAPADDPLKVEAAKAKAATEPSAGVGGTAKAPLELDEPPQTGVAQVQTAKSTAPAAVEPTATPAAAPSTVAGPNEAAAKSANEAKATLASKNAAAAHHQPGHRPLPTLVQLPTLPPQRVGKRPATTTTVATSGVSSAPASGVASAPVAAPRPAAVAPASGATSAPADAGAHATGPGMLVVATSPWCRVIVDGTDRGATPLEIKLPAGQHSVLLSNPEFHIKREMAVDIKAGATVRKRFDFAD